MTSIDSLGDGVRALLKAATAFVPATGLGIVRQDGPEHAVLVYVDAFGATAYRAPARDFSRWFRPRRHNLLHATADELAANPLGLVESRLLHTGFSDDIRRQCAARHVITLPVADAVTSTFVASLSNADSLTDSQTLQLDALAQRVVDLLTPPQSPNAELDLLRRLESAERLLPALFQVLDVREIFDRLSTITKDVIRHDFASLGILSDDLTQMELYVQTSPASAYHPGGQMPFPTVQTHAWLYRLVDDLTMDPHEHDMQSARAGGRASLRVAIRHREGILGALNFTSRDPLPYTAADLVIARRIADYIALALSYQRIVEQARRDDELRARATNLELLDELLTSLIDTGDLRHVFERICAIAQRVLPHDAAWLPIVLPDGRHAKMHATVGVPTSANDIVDVPDDLVRNPNWESEIIDDLLTRTERYNSNIAASGFRSLLRTPVRLEGRFAGTVLFASKKVAAFASHDILVARRIADRLALLVSRDREVEAYKRAEEASAQTTNLERLDELLATLVDTGELPDIFSRISTLATKVLPHDAVALMVRLPEGTQAKVYASSGFPGVLPETMEIPRELLDDSKWEADLVDAFPADGSSFAVAARMGLKSALRVRVRLDGQFAGALVFFSKTPGKFAQPDVLVASRIADRLAVTLARDRELAAAKRAEEASARASKLESRVRQLIEELDARTGYRRVVGDSAEWRTVLTQATQVAPNDTTVLLLGESGTGKEVVARFVHRASPRANGPFVALNCAALPDQLLEAELFGYERGAYTGAVQSKPGQLEQAAGGTLFLDEVGEMSLPAQAKFLRVLQEREFQRLGGTRVLRTDARIIAATNRDLERAIAQNLFREDLYYRLNVFAILLPALRDRRRDILPLSEAFLAEIGRSISRPAGGISREARDRLLAYHWPGNVRELRNILERASILCDGGLIAPEHLAMGLGTRPAPAPIREPPAVQTPEGSRPTAPAPVSSAGELKSMERDMIEQALRRVRFNKSKAAKDLGLTRTQLYLRMKKYGLE